MNPSTRQQKPSVRRKSSGFALVVTLSLMILLTVIAVGLLSLSAVSLRGSSQEMARAEAQANARLALMLAIGDLQKQLGPDQRVSMTADQRPKTGADGGESASAMGNRQWTGVFDSWSSTSDARPTPTFRAWLVSGHPGQITRQTLADTTLTGASVIDLVGAGTMGSADMGQVKVSATDLKVAGAKTGRMAWWVGDQGVKAALSAPPLPKDTSLATLRQNLQSAPPIAAGFATAGTVKPFASLDMEDPRVPLVTSWKQAGFLASDPSSPRPLFHDLAASSTGLLTNVREGGFRKDLSMKFETFTSPPDLSISSNVLYKVKSAVTGVDEEGINFLELWSYYNLYKQLIYGGGGNFTTGGSIPSSVPYLRTAESIVGVTQDNWDIYKQPITVSYQIVLSFESYAAPTNAGGQGQALYVNMDPIVTIWNPLDVPVDIAPQTANECWMYTFWVIPYDINVKVNGGATRKCSLLRSVYVVDSQSTRTSIDSNMLALSVGEMERLTLKPGEVLKISQTGATMNNTTSVNKNLRGRKGFNYGSGARFPLLDDQGKYILLQPGDLITYEASPNNLTAGKDNESGGNVTSGFGGNSRRFSLTHNSVIKGNPWGTNAHIGMVSVDHCYGQSRAKVNEVRTTNNPYRNKTLSNSERVLANDARYSEVYPVIQGQNTREIPASGIATNKAPFMVHSYDIKTEVENKRGTRMMARFNPKAHNVDFYNLSDEERDMLPYQPGITPLLSWLNAPLDESTSGQGFFGSSLASQLGSNFVNTHSVPRQPIVSLAAFQDSFANGFNRLTESVGTEHAMARQPLLPQISHAIGNSLAPSLIPPDKTEGSLTNNPRPLADHSYLANRALWDDWFMSGITPQQSHAFTEKRDQKTVAEEFFSGKKALPVARYMPDLGGQQASQLATSFFTGSVPNDPAVRNVASYLRVDGMFNVNSTSVEAWKTVLGSLKGRQLVVRDESGVESIAPLDNNIPLARVGAARDILIEDGSNKGSNQWNGRRALTDNEIEALARAIVKEVRKRGPFLSLADFINRRVGTDMELAKSGAIQSALDSNDVPINKNQNTDRSVASNVAARFKFPEAEQGAMNYGGPSFVKQADILTPIAPVLSVRSDSFIIRAYGEAVDKAGKVTARAWCEAVVERDRNFVDPSDQAETLPSLVKTTNKTFGRRFNLITFRWLNPSEI